MLTILLTRKTIKGNAVAGEMIIPFSQCRLYHPDEKDVVVETLENADFIIPTGTYPLSVTYSPKFKKNLPLIEEVPEREGIRIHMGTKPEHSTGCVLTSYFGMLCIQTLFNRINKFFEDENVVITIKSDF